MRHGCLELEGFIEKSVYVFEIFFDVVDKMLEGITIVRSRLFRDEIGEAG